MGKKITGLTEHSTPAAGDLLFIHDLLTGTLKKITVDTLLSRTGGVGNVHLEFDGILAQNVGTQVVFDFPFESTDYVFIPFGVKAGAAVIVSIGEVSDGSKTAALMTVYPAVDDTTVYFLAMGVRS